MPSSPSASYIPSFHAIIYPHTYFHYSPHILIYILMYPLIKLPIPTYYHPHIIIVSFLPFSVSFLLQHVSYYPRIYPLLSSYYPPITLDISWQLIPMYTPYLSSTYPLIILIYQDIRMLASFINTCDKFGKGQKYFYDILSFKCLS